MATTGIATRAQRLLGGMEIATQGSGGQFVRISDEAEAETERDLHELALICHGGGELLPDGWRYRMMYDALSRFAEISEYTDDEEAAADFLPEWADADTPVYSSELLEWLGSHTSRAEWCDEACAQGYVDGEVPIIQRIGAGHWLEREHVYRIVLDWLEEA